MAILSCSPFFLVWTRRRRCWVFVASYPSSSFAVPGSSVFVQVRKDPAAAPENGENQKSASAPLGSQESAVIFYNQGYEKTTGTDEFHERPIIEKKFVNYEKKCLTKGKVCGTLIKLSAKKRVCCTL